MALSRAVVALTARSLNEVGVDVTLTQYRMLIVLASHGPQRVANLAAELGVAPSTMTRLCDRLVSRGLATRQQSTLDRRVVYVGLTDAGKDLVGEVMARRRELLAGLAAQLETRDPAGFADAAEGFAVLAGELPERQWWQQWDRSTMLDLDLTESGRKGLVRR
jgi:DNA-binding MarR family transcriptional regulator